jgi:hypothetical protein
MTTHAKHSWHTNINEAYNYDLIYAIMRLTTITYRKRYYGAADKVRGDVRHR